MAYTNLSTTSWARRSAATWFPPIIATGTGACNICTEVELFSFFIRDSCHILSYDIVVLKANSFGIDGMPFLGQPRILVFCGTSARLRLFRNLTSPLGLLLYFMGGPGQFGLSFVHCLLELVIEKARTFVRILFAVFPVSVKHTFQIGDSLFSETNHLFQFAYLFCLLLVRKLLIHCVNIVISIE